MRKALGALSMLTLLIPLCTIGVLGWLTLARFVDVCERSMAQTLSTEATRWLGHEVRIGSIRYAKGRLFATDVRIAEGRRLADRGPIASAQTLSAPFDLNRFASGDVRVPRLSEIVISDAAIHIRRSHQRDWNFTDLFRPSGKPSPRATIGRLRFINLRLDYFDEALLTGPKGHTVSAACSRVRGDLVFGPNGGVSWSADGNGASNEFAHAVVNGSYTKAPKTIFVTITAQGADLPHIVSLISTPLRVQRGKGDGSANLSWQIRPDRHWDATWSVDMQVHDADASLPKLPGIVRNATGHIRAASGQVQVDVDALWAGSNMRVQGKLVDFQHPWIDGDLSIRNAGLKQVSDTVGLGRRYPWANDLHLSADADAHVRGPLDDLSIDITGPVMVRSATAKGVALAAPSRFAVHVSGTTKDPRIQADGTLPLIQYRGHTVTGVSVRASFAQGDAAMDFRASVAGGQVTGRADAHLAKGITNYRATARARSIDLTRLGMLPGKNLAGTIDADARFAGITSAPTPTGEVIVQAHDLRYNNWTLPYGSVRLHSAGEVVTLDPAMLRDGAARLFAEGSIDVPHKTVDIRVTGDTIDLSAIPVQPASPDNALQGVVYIRDGRIVGPWQNPNIAATAYAYNAGTHRFHVDHAMFTMVGNRHRLLFESARATRAPAQVQLTGVVANPLSTHPMIVVDGNFTNLEIRDVADVAGRTADVSGTAHGNISVTGEIARPRVILSSIAVDQPSAGDYDLDTLGASIRYEPWGGGMWHIDGLSATMGQSSLTGNASITPDGHFSVSANACNVDLAMLDNYLPTGVNIDGHGNASAEASGTTDGKHIDGSLAVDVPSMAVNRVDTGTFQARLEMTDGVVTTKPGTDGRPAVTAGPSGAWLSIDNLRYDPQGETQATGHVNGLPVDTLRRLVMSSPYFAEHQETLPQEWLKPEEGRIAGSVSGAIQVTGPAAHPTASLAWNTAGMRLGSQPVNAFTGDVSLDREHVSLNDLRVEAADAVFTARGSLVFGQKLDGGITIEGLTIDQIRHWLPAGTVPDGLTGTVELVDATASGQPTAPRIEASADMKDVVWRIRDESTGSYRSVRFHRVNLARAQIADGRLSADDLRTIISADEGMSQPAATEPAPASSPTPAHGRAATPSAPEPRGPSGVRYEAHASFQTGFQWSPPFLIEDSPTELTAAVRKQKFPRGSSILPGVPVQIDGGIDAMATFRGTLSQLRGDVQTGNVPPPSIDGYVALTADRIRFGNMKTSLGDVDVYLKMQGGEVKVAPNPVTGRSFSARVDLVDPITGAQMAQGGRIKMDGALSFGDPRSTDNLHLTADQLVFAESPLPVFGSGRAVGEVAPARAGTPGLDLRVSGSLANPLISGRANLARTDIRMPESLSDAPLRAPVLPVTPRFDLGLTVGDRVRVHAAQVTMDVHTPAGSAIELRGDAQTPRLNGILVIDRGTLQFPTTRFSIERGGTVTMRYPSTSLSDPMGQGLAVVLDLSATTSLSAVSVNGTRKRYTITVDAKGPLNSEQPLAITEPGDLSAVRPTSGGLRLTFRSDPPDLALSSSGLQGRITGLLGGDEAISNLFARGSGIGRALGDQMAGIFSASLLPDILESSGVLRTFGLEELSFNYDRGQDVTFHVSRQLTGPLYLSYWQRLSGTTGVSLTDRAAWELSTSLRLRDNLQFSWTTDEQRTNAFLVEGVFRF